MLAPRAPRRRPTRALAAGALPAALAAALVAPVLLAAPAAAHDTLLESVPADGAVVEPPEVLTLRYSANILDISTLVVVRDADDEVVVESEGTVEGPLVTFELPELTDGPYDVSWRVVSSDGHPIEDTFTFTVEGAEPAPEPEPTTEPESEPTTEPESEPTTEPEATTEPEDAETTGDPLPADAGTTSEDTDGDAGGIPTGLVVGAIIGAALLAAALWFILRRGRDTTDTTSGPTDTTPEP